MFKELKENMDKEWKEIRKTMYKQNDNMNRDKNYKRNQT